jgi:hypothetical protein
VHYRGSILSGPHPGSGASTEVDPADSLAVSCRVLWWPGASLETFEPLTRRARAAIAMYGDQPVLAAPSLLTGARTVTAGGERALLERLDGDPSVVEYGAFGAALPTGVTLLFLGRGRDLSALTGGRSLSKRIAFAIERPAAGGPPQVAIVMDDVTAGQAAPLAEGLPRGFLERELLLLDTPLEPGSPPLVMIVPSPFVGDGASAWVAILEVALPPRSGEEAAEHARRAAACAEDLEAAARAAEERAARLEDDELRRRQLARALEMLHLEDVQRSALVLMAGTTGARLAEDVALSASDAELAEYAASISHSAAELDVISETGDALGWTLERGAWLFLSRADEPGPELQGVLLRHAGEVGRFPGLIEDAVAVSSDRASLLERLEAENLVFLEDSNPAARVRAHRWLAARGLAPDDFDPLDIAAERQAALFEHLEYPEEPEEPEEPETEPETETETETETEQEPSGESGR